MDGTKVRALLDAQDWSDLHARLYAFALARCASRTKAQVEVRAQAKDLVQEAIARVYAAESKWDPDAEPNLQRYLMSVINGLLSNERSRAAAKRNVSLSKEAPRGGKCSEAVADARALPEEVVVKTDLFARRLALLEERLAGDADARRLLELMVSGMDSPADLRKATKWSANDLMATRRRMLRSAALVARAIGGAEDEEPLAAGLDDEEEVA